MMSVGLTAKDISQVSLKSQNDQITEGRFDATKFDMGANTDMKLLEEYMKKEQHTIAIETDSV